jgi:hypothetical protein
VTQGLFLCEEFEKEGFQVGDVRAHAHKIVFVRQAEGEDGGKEFSVAFGGENGDYGRRQRR